MCQHQLRVCDEIHCLRSDRVWFEPWGKLHFSSPSPSSHSGTWREPFYALRQRESFKLCPALSFRQMLKVIHKEFLWYEIFAFLSSMNELSKGKMSNPSASCTDGLIYCHLHIFIVFHDGSFVVSGSFNCHEGKRNISI